ncbi:MAG: LysR family transcriptional regulator [Oceanospirillaceae bacterium]|uniref:LysR substrate-binding domain-containing protein n=2 Tax=unclassified Thalassolituus TaxID=2624967 RepID=UPI000C43A09A|nr:LysR family transcriptional regulator [Thalassolituus sp. UBA6592]MAS26590.1 LysR family transcriptional regulator [Oceanospirillaceae bacterium]MAY00935.1 LysR family transcriptional regulator [Oceanospirillaceae bacterium]MBL34187.1 LysR family transcriptional regulator [Oceanospirillaceae bacterium]MBS52080.1 LysR family transcriptional regulator [Oceanospirillaceae bacterium]
MKELDALRIFLQVAEQKSFSAAADVLDLPRSTVSAAVQQLENELDVRLLQRTTRRVMVTAEGERFMERARSLLHDADELRTMFCGEHTLKGVIRVDMPVVVARDMVLPCLAEFLARYPQVQVELSSTDRQVDPMAEGFDLVLRAGDLSDSSLIARRIAEHRMVNCISRGYQQSYGTPQSLDDLKVHKLIGYSATLGRGGDLFDYVDARGQVQQLRMTTLVTVNNAVAYTSACLAGLGIIQTPYAGVASLINDGSLLTVLDDFVCAPLPLSVLYPERRFQPQRVRVFMQWLTDIIQQKMN